tara:strand:- start:6969 stop:7280 length:312 start_codon:yes stop_codon:yes gene_type:complete
MTTHNPTTLNRQGADKGTQYRSVIFYLDEHQQKIAAKVLKEVQQYYDTTIITEMSPLTVFYETEQEHQNYYKENTQQGHCSYIIKPLVKESYATTIFIYIASL